MKIASWNINSVRARLPLLQQWLQRVSPDILFLQEIKCEEQQFPALELAALGYQSLIKGQKAYHGVATLSRTPLELVSNHLTTASDEPARFLHARTKEFELINIYAPNGNPLGSDKYVYKLDWLEQLYNKIYALQQAQTPFLLAGDFNIIPTALDAANPQNWLNDALYQPAVRQWWHKLLNLGLYDALFSQASIPNNHYTFWDYQGGAWPRNDGIRIDHVLLSPTLADRLHTCTIDREVRGEEKASDHVPIMVELRDA